MRHVLAEVGRSERTRFMDELLVRVTAPHFVAGFGSRRGVVATAAPILRKALGTTDDEARAIIKQNGWKASIVRSYVRRPDQGPA
ncbi:hypothetical protein [Bradyrhizobium japonicum]|jgi:type IV secretory pathway protease TraF|nr:hypothetical protein [Bradyrhizobium japonicum]MCS3552091.1 type IV secretory pathway protease TraF [Bradyrhizobium japonicum]